MFVLKTKRAFPAKITYENRNWSSIIISIISLSSN